MSWAVFIRVPAGKFLYSVHPTQAMAVMAKPADYLGDAVFHEFYTLEPVPANTLSPDYRRAREWCE